MVTTGSLACVVQGIILNLANCKLLQTKLLVNYYLTLYTHWGIKGYLTEVKVEDANSLWSNISILGLCVNSSPVVHVKPSREPSSPLFLIPPCGILLMVE